MIKQALGIYIPTAAIGVLSTVGLVSTASQQTPVCMPCESHSAVPIPEQHIGNVTQSVTIGDPRTQERERIARIGYGTTEDAAAVLGVTARHIIDLIHEGEIPAYQVGRRHRIPAEWFRTVRNGSAHADG